MSGYIYDDPEAQDILERVKAGGVKELEAAVKKGDKTRDMHKSLCFYYAAMYGAIAALDEGRPESMQTLLAKPLMIDLGLGRHMKLTEARVIILSEMMFSKQEGGYHIETKSHGSALKAAVAGLSEDDRREALNELLQRSLSDNGEKTPIASIAAMLDCGANAAANRSAALAHAINDQHHEAVVMLYNHGASFDDALTIIKGGGFGIIYHQRDIDAVEHYKKQLGPVANAIPVAQKPKQGNYDM